MNKFFTGIKKRIIRSLEKMAEANKRNYGNKRLDCCSMDKKNENNIYQAHKY